MTMKEFLLKNAKLVLVVFSFIVTFWYQQMRHTDQISDLNRRYEVLELECKARFSQMDQSKLDKVVFDNYTNTMDDMKEAIKDIQSDIKKIISKEYR